MISLMLLVFAGCSDLPEWELVSSEELEQGSVYGSWSCYSDASRPDTPGRIDLSFEADIEFTDVEVEFIPDNGSFVSLWQPEPYVWFGTTQEDEVQVDCGMGFSTIFYAYDPEDGRIAYRLLVGGSP